MIDLWMKGPDKAAEGQTCGEAPPEPRVATIVASHHKPQWIVAVKETGLVWLVDYADLKNLKITQIETEAFLHDGGWDASKRYFTVAANQRNKLVVVDAEKEKLEAIIKVGKIPHPGRGANWANPPIQRSICVTEKKKPDKVAKCWEVAAEGRAVHLEYNKAGDEVWVSVWNRKDKQSEIVVYDDKTLKEKTRIRDPRLGTPPGKFNVYNTTRDIY